MPSTFGGEDDDAPLLQVADGAAADEGLGELRDLYGRLDARVDSDLFERVLKDDGVHDGRQHAYVVGAGAVHVAGALGDAAEDVAAADDDRDLDAHLVVHGLDLLGDGARHVHVNAVVLRAHQGLAGNFQQDAAEGRPVGVRCRHKFPVEGFRFQVSGFKFAVLT
jgi:hypothetical protein